MSQRYQGRSSLLSNCARILSIANGITPSRLIHNAVFISFQSLSAPPDLKQQTREPDHNHPQSRRLGCRRGQRFRIENIFHAAAEALGVRNLVQICHLEAKNIAVFRSGRDLNVVRHNQRGEVAVKALPRKRERKLDLIDGKENVIGRKSDQQFVARAAAVGDARDKLNRIARAAPQVERTLRRGTGRQVGESECLVCSANRKKMSLPPSCPRLNRRARWAPGQPLQVRPQGRRKANCCWT